MPVCCACWDERHLQPPRVPPKHVADMEFYDQEECGFCGAATWAGLFIEEAG